MEKLITPAENEKMAGYLEKKNKLRFVPTWHRYWFVLDGKLLLYYRSKDDYLKLSPCRGSINLGLTASIQNLPSVGGAYPIQIVTRAQVISLRARDPVLQRHWLQALTDAMALTRISSPIKNTNGTQYFRYSMTDITSPSNLKVDESASTDTSASTSSKQDNSPPRHKRQLSYDNVSILVSEASTESQTTKSVDEANYRPRSFTENHQDALFPSINGVDKFEADCAASVPDLCTLSPRNRHSYAFDKHESLNANRLRLSIKYQPTNTDVLDSTVESSPCLVTAMENADQNKVSCESVHIYEEFRHSAIQSEPVDDMVTTGLKIMTPTNKIKSENAYEIMNEDVHTQDDKKEHKIKQKKTFAEKIHFPTLKRSSSKHRKSNGSAIEASNKTDTLVKKEKTRPKTLQRKKSFLHKLFKFRSSNYQDKQVISSPERQFTYYNMNPAEEMYEAVDYSSFYDNMITNQHYYTKSRAEKSPSGYDYKENFKEQSTQVDSNSLSEEEKKSPIVSGQLLIFRKEVMDELKVKMEHKRKSISEAASNFQVEDFKDEDPDSDHDSISEEVPLYSKVNKPPKHEQLANMTQFEQLRSPEIHQDENEDFSRYFRMACRTPEIIPPIPPKNRVRQLSPGHDVPLNNSPVINPEITFPVLFKQATTTVVTVMSDDNYISQIDIQLKPNEKEIVQGPALVEDDLVTCNGKSIHSGDESDENSRQPLIIDTNLDLLDKLEFEINSTPEPEITEEITKEISSLNNFIIEESIKPLKKHWTTCTEIVLTPHQGELSDEVPEINYLRGEDPDYDIPRAHKLSESNSQERIKKIIEKARESIEHHESRIANEVNESSMIPIMNFELSTSPVFNHYDNMDSGEFIEKTEASLERISSPMIDLDPDPVLWIEFPLIQEQTDSLLMEQCRDNESLLIIDTPQSLDEDSSFSMESACTDETDIVSITSSEVSAQPEVVLRRKDKSLDAPNTSNARLSYVAMETLIIEEEEVDNFDDMETPNINKFPQLVSTPYLTVTTEDTNNENMISKRPSQIPKPEDIRASGVSCLQNFLAELLHDEDSFETQTGLNRLGHSVAISKLKEYFETESQT